MQGISRGIFDSCTGVVYKLPESLPFHNIFLPENSRKYRGLFTTRSKTSSVAKKAEAR